MLQTLRQKQKYQVSNIGVEKIKLSRLLVLRTSEFKDRQEMTQNVLTVLHNTLYCLGLSH